MPYHSVSENGLVLDWCQAITWNNADLLSTGPLGTNLSIGLLFLMNCENINTLRPGQTYVCHLILKQLGHLKIYIYIS